MNPQWKRITKNIYIDGVVLRRCTKANETNRSEQIRARLMAGKGPRLSILAWAPPANS